MDQEKMSETMKRMFLSENNWEMTNNNKTQKKREMRDG